MMDCMDRKTQENRNSKKNPSEKPQTKISQPNKKKIIKNKIKSQSLIRLKKEKN